MAAFKTALIVLFLSVRFGWACYPHTNLMVCWEGQEGRGTQWKDTSGNGYEGTLTGGPAWVPSHLSPPKAPPYISVASATVANTGDWQVSFPGDAGVNVRSAVTSRFDFAPSLPFVAGLTFQLATLTTLVTQMDLMGCADIGKGWSVYIDRNPPGANAITFQPLGQATVILYNIGDTNPHRMLFGRNSSGRTMFAIDGKVVKNTTSANMTTTGGTEYLAVGDHDNLNSAFNGKANRAVVYNFDFTTDYFAAFAQNEYLYWQGMDNGAGVGE